MYKIKICANCMYKLNSIYYLIRFLLQCGEICISIIIPLLQIRRKVKFLDENVNKIYLFTI